MRTKAIPFMAAVLIATTTLVASAVSPAAAPDGSKVLIDRTKTCQVSVPSDWVVDKFSPTSATAADKKADLTMSVTVNRTLSQVKATIEMLFPPKKVIEDSASRLWYAYKADSVAVDSPEVNWYVGIPVKGNVCGAQIDFKNPSSEPMMKQIVESMSAVK